MATIKVSIKNRDTLVLEEDAKKGDEIDLKTLFKIDSSYIEKIIEENKKDLIEKRIENEKNNIENHYKAQEAALKLSLQKELDASKQETKNEYEEKINSLKEENKNLDVKIKLLEGTKEKDIKAEILRVETNKNEEIQKLKNEIDKLNATKEQEIKNIKLEENRKTYDEITSLKTTIDNLKREKEQIIETNDLQAKVNLFEQKEKLKGEFEDKFESLKKEKEEFEAKYNQLSLTKSTLNVKKLGEELEKWCNSEFEEASQYGFENTEWHKDNEAVKEEGETKGSKADYIFKVYSSGEFNSDTLLASVCLEMKNESNVSTNTKKNSDHYSKLDKDRNKKSCEYALLVSELEWETNNDAPVRKVNGYDKMYVVRPQYMISFLSLIYALSNKYKDLINEDIKEKLELKSSIEIKEEFEKFKKTYLEDQISGLEKEVNTIQTNNNTILAAATKNEALLANLIEKRIQTIKTKIERFDIKKIGRKLEKLER